MQGFSLSPFIFRKFYSQEAVVKLPSASCPADYQMAYAPVLIYSLLKELRYDRVTLLIRYSVDGYMYPTTVICSPDGRWIPSKQIEQSDTLEYTCVPPGQNASLDPRFSCWFQTCSTMLWGKERVSVSISWIIITTRISQLSTSSSQSFLSSSVFCWSSFASSNLFLSLSFLMVRKLRNGKHRKKNICLRLLKRRAVKKRAAANVSTPLKTPGEEPMPERAKEQEKVLEQRVYCQFF